jgi:UDP-N-acetylglucosamine diphosphorylase/glucosamine-1-phosphate N-acetyltransferase
MNIIFFEDDKALNFEPISLSHPVYTLLAGTSPLYAKWLKTLKPKEYSFLSRPHLAPMLEAQSGRQVNNPGKADSLFINGRLLPTKDTIAAAKKLAPGYSLRSSDTLLAFRLEPLHRLFSLENLNRLYDTETLNRFKNSLKSIQIASGVVSYLWDLVNMNGDLIVSEFSSFKIKSKKQGRANPKANLIKRDRIYIGPDVVIGAGVTIDASEGPVIIERGTAVEPLTYIKGPVYIGRDCRIVGGKIREGCSFGPVCRVGGEVEEAIMLGFDNKYHEGFLGHAYLGEWVNLGAMTTNSDLKNNYGTIAVNVNGDSIDTGQLKVGCFIGDHTKTGIGTLLNTGISIGFSCNLYGGTLFTDRAIPSFSWGTPGNLVEYRLDKARETAAASMKRRSAQFTELHGKLFAEIQRLAKPRGIR